MVSCDVEEAAETTTRTVKRRATKRDTNHNQLQRTFRRVAVAPPPGLGAALAPCVAAGAAAGTPDAIGTSPSTSTPDAAIFLAQALQFRAHSRVRASAQAVLPRQPNTFRAEKRLRVKLLMKNKRGTSLKLRLLAHRPASLNTRQSSATMDEVKVSDDGNTSGVCGDESAGLGTRALQACAHLRFVNHGVPLGEKDSKLDFSGIKECASCGKGFLNWVCLGCFQVCVSSCTQRWPPGSLYGCNCQVFCGRTVHHWHHNCGGQPTQLTVDMAGLSVKCVPCKRALTPEEVYENASLRTALGAIHDVKFGHRLMLVPDSAKKTGQDSLAGQVAGALGASQSIDVKWKQFQDRFQQILNQSVGAVATAFEHEELGVVVPKALPAEDVRTRAFGGERPTLEAFAAGVLAGRFKNIVVVAGAGMSCAAGLPDFRTPGTGLYYQLEKYNLPSPHSMFDIAYFKSNPEPFHVFAKELYPGNYAPTRAHYFVRLLEQNGILLRLYTQNVDGLDRMAGTPDSKVIECHGGFGSAACVECRASVDPEIVKRCIFSGTIARCPGCGGLAKPGIVFFGEGLGGPFHRHRQADMEAADAVIVIGTSLTVLPTASLPRAVGSSVPRVLINRERVGDFDFDEAVNYRDVPVLGDCDAGADALADALGWRADLDALVRAGRESHPDAFAKSERARKLAAEAEDGFAAKSPPA